MKAYDDLRVRNIGGPSNFCSARVFVYCISAWHRDSLIIAGYQRMTVNHGVSDTIGNHSFNLCKVHSMSMCSLFSLYCILVQCCINSSPIQALSPCCVNSVSGQVPIDLSYGHGCCQRFNLLRRRRGITHVAALLGSVWTLLFLAISSSALLHIFSCKHDPFLIKLQ